MHHYYICIYSITYFSPGELKITVRRLCIFEAQHSLKRLFDQINLIWMNYFSKKNIKGFIYYENIITSKQQ